MGTDLVVRFAGEGGQGQVTAAEGLAQAAARVGYHVQTFATYPSQIEGGPVWAQTRVSTNKILTQGDQLDVLVALNRQAYETHIGDLRDGGVLIYNSRDIVEEPPGNVIGLDAEALARDTGNPRAANIIMIGAVAELASMPSEYFEEWIKERFTRGRPNDAEIIGGNVKALEVGIQAARASGYSVESLDEPPAIERQRILVNGNNFLALGALAAGLETFYGYPISPATTILVYMESNLNGADNFVGQASSEIESIAAIVGAGYAGRKVMTSTAGPGLSLMGEGLGLAWMAEIPCVVVDVQRGGPATGLPTKTEQSDLFAALNPGHGDMRVPVIAPGSVAECFQAGVDALNWAERYQGPVILLTEMSIAERNEDVDRPDLSQVKVERRLVSDGSMGNRRYEGAGLTPFPVPGNPGAYVANASEHDEQGDTTHQPYVHINMTERRFSKLKLLEDGTYESENTSASVAIMPWGGSKGPARAAFNRLSEAGEEVGWYYTMYLNPLPPALVEELKQKELVIVPELNYLGQFSSILRSMGINAVSITQYTGLPFKEQFLVERVREHLRSGRLAAV
ncbi:MAG: 2-oxoacid:acceptor oxidoreductase subunit alpha [Dehalococcoidia bacterium]|nr:2-oxoacid:acceptor oxidoreductase subunit alpha [Dehalococcoidia bacterium]